MNFVVGALLLGRLASDPEIFDQLSNIDQLSPTTDLSEESLPSQLRSQMESDIFWATQVASRSLSLTHSSPACPCQ
jgi:hypothetical protein